LASAANKAKTKWNAEHYSQIKISVAPELAAAFQSACASAGVSMTAALSKYMAEFSALTVKVQKCRPPVGVIVSTKEKRRKLLKNMLLQMEKIRDAQERAMDNIPENFHGSDSYEAAEESLALMDEVIDLLGAIY
jgi:hypothetical protein